MHRPTEYQTMKRLLFARKDFDPNLGTNGVNRIIHDSCQAALDRTEGLERDYLLASLETLKTKCKQMGDLGALELLATLGNVLEAK
jgi:hypothetical protein